MADKQVARRIVVFTGTGSNTVLEGSTHSVWGELKKELQEKGILGSNLDAVVRETKTTLVLDGAELPSTPFTLFLTPKKMKSGAIRDGVGALTKEEVIQLAESLELSTNGDVRRTLRRHFKRTATPSESPSRSALLKLIKTPSKSVEETPTEEKACSKAEKADKKAKKAAKKAKKAAKMAELEANGELVTIDTAKELVGAAVDKTKEALLSIIDRIKTNEITAAEGVDLFAGLEVEFDAIKKEHQANS